MRARHRTLLFLIEIVAAPSGFGQKLCNRYVLSLRQTQVLTTISVLKPKDPCATVFAIVNMSATEFLFINEGVNVLFGTETERYVHGENHV